MMNTFRSYSHVSATLMHLLNKYLHCYTGNNEKDRLTEVRPDTRGPNVKIKTEGKDLCFCQHYRSFNDKKLYPKFSTFCCLPNLGLIFKEPTLTWLILLIACLFSILLIFHYIFFLLSLAAY